MGKVNCLHILDSGFEAVMHVCVCTHTCLNERERYTMHKSCNTFPQGALEDVSNILYW